MAARSNTTGAHETPAPGQLRLSVVLSGGASLGAYEAGALAAVLVAVRWLQRESVDRVVLDAVGGASAGALVGLFGAHALLEGFDPEDFLYQAWVERVSLDLLRRRAGQGLLSFDRLRDDIRKFLGPHGYPPPSHPHPQDAAIGVHVGLTGLQGLTYPVRALDGRESFTATTYADWGRFVLHPGGGAKQILEPEGTSPLDFVLASAAHPGAFTPALLDRSDHADYYHRHGIDNFPEAGHVWYSDGGLMQAQPLGYALAAARAADEQGGLGGDFRRAVVLIDPRSEDPSGASAWTDPSRTPKWLHGLRRALEILPAQTAYDDAARMEKTNRRLQWAEALADALAPQLGDGAEDALRDFVARLRDERSRLPREDEVPDVAPEGTGAEPGVRQLLRRAIADVSGLARKEAVEVSVISPLLLAAEDGDDVSALLAGDFMADFGGFLSRDIRNSDFLLGYASAEKWLPGGLRATGVDDAALEAMAKEVADRAPGDWQEANKGRVEPKDLGWAGRLDLARLGWDALRALAAHAIDLPRASDGARRGLRSLRRK
jgi:predicted acylesterase/phospholipase RssA